MSVAGRTVQALDLSASLRTCAIVHLLLCKTSGSPRCCGWVIGHYCTCVGGSEAFFYVTLRHELASQHPTDLQAASTYAPNRADECLRQIMLPPGGTGEFARGHMQQSCLAWGACRQMSSRRRWTLWTRRAQLPLRLGGLFMRSAKVGRRAAYRASWIESLPLWTHCRFGADRSVTTSRACGTWERGAYVSRSVVATGCCRCRVSNCCRGKPLCGGGQPPTRKDSEAAGHHITTLPISSAFHILCTSCCFTASVSTSARRH